MKYPLAFLDSFSGCLPCKVLRVTDHWVESDLAGRSSHCTVTVKLTASRGPYYTKGKIIESSALHVIPRNHVKGNRIIGGYRWHASPQPSPSDLNKELAGAGSSWFAELRQNGNRLAVFYPSSHSPAEAADRLRSLGVSGPYASLSGPCLEFPNVWSKPESLCCCP